MTEMQTEFREFLGKARKLINRSTRLTDIRFIWTMAWYAGYTASKRESAKQIEQHFERTE
jgi:hypothetical protein